MYDAVDVSEMQIKMWLFLFPCDSLLLQLVTADPNGASLPDETS